MTAAITSSGSSDVAYYLDNASQSIGRYFNQSAVIGKQSAFNELIDIWDECRESNWDGNDAFPIRESTFVNAYLFIEALPLGSPLLPSSVGAEPDGHLTLEWYRHPRWILSLSISPEGILYYAALFGNSTSRGSEVFFNEVPLTILSLIQRVMLNV